LNTQTNTKGGYFLQDDISAFDASFFNLSSETASAMDPQMRLQLESVYEATEDGKLDSAFGDATTC
jgi:acyl transferase domain-containing protein